MVANDSDSAIDGFHKRPLLFRVHLGDSRRTCPHANNDSNDSDTNSGYIYGVYALLFQASRSLHIKPGCPFW